LFLTRKSPPILLIVQLIASPVWLRVFLFGVEVCDYAITSNHLYWYWTFAEICSDRLVIRWASQPLNARRKPRTFRRNVQGLDLGSSAFCHSDLSDS
jgi:hypothetical protein